MENPETVRDEIRRLYTDPERIREIVDSFRRAYDARVARDEASLRAEWELQVWGASDSDDTERIREIVDSFRPLGRLGDPAAKLKADLEELAVDVGDVIERDRLAHGGEVEDEDEDEEW